MHYEEYHVNSTGLSPAAPAATTRLTMNVIKIGNPPTPMAQVRVNLDTVYANRSGSEIMTMAVVSVSDTSLFNLYKGYLTDPTCTCHVRYRSDDVSGNDPISQFQVIASYGAHSD